MLIHRKATSAHFEMPKKLALPRMPGVEQSLFGLLPAVITGIIAATNRQTAVSEEELSVREDFHRSLEQWFAAHPAPHRLWYERRSKQYATRPEVEKTRVVNRGQLTRAYAAMFLGEPHATAHYRELTTKRRDDRRHPAGGDGP
ncbi:hypothetical protein Areg01_38560 [Actinoplanes regularis]|nr:hypothetical protein Areg01_38560 [Actinoplanes regularis]